MIEQDINLIIKLWENGESINSIIRLLPYKENVTRKEIAKLRQNGTLKGSSGKTKAKTWEKVLQAYNGGITSPYELSETFGLKVGTINTILSNSHLDRARPKHNYKPYPLSAKTQLILQDIKQEIDVKDIIIRHNVSRQYVYKIKNKYLGAKKW